MFTITSADDIPQKRAKFMASVFRQLAWYEEDGGTI